MTVTGRGAGRAAWGGRVHGAGAALFPDLTDEQVRAAYLLRIRAVHPDNGGDARRLRR